MKKKQQDVARKLILAEFIFGYLAPFVYIFQNGLNLRAWRVGDVVGAIIVASLIFSSVYLFPRIRLGKIRLPEKIFLIAMLAVSLALIAVSLTISNDYRYAGGGGFLQKLSLNILIPFLLFFSVIYIRNPSIAWKKRLGLTIVASLALGFSISGINSALTFLGLISLFISDRIRIKLQVPIMIFLAVASIGVGNYIKKDAGLWETISLFSVAHFVERQSSHYVTLTRSIPTSPPEIAQCGTGVEILKSTFRYRTDKLLGQEEGGLIPEYLSIGHFNRAVAFGEVVDLSGGMSPGVIASGFIYSCSFGWFFDVLYLLLIYTLIRNLLKSTNIKGLADVVYLWLILRVVFQNPADVASLIDPSFLMLLVLCAASVIGIKPANAWDARDNVDRSGR